MAGFLGFRAPGQGSGAGRRSQGVYGRPREGAPSHKIDAPDRTTPPTGPADGLQRRWTRLGPGQPLTSSHNRLTQAQQEDFLSGHVPTGGGNPTSQEDFLSQAQNDPQPQENLQNGHDMNPLAAHREARAALDAQRARLDSVMGIARQITRTARPPILVVSDAREARAVLGVDTENALTVTDITGGALGTTPIHGWHATNLARQHRDYDTASIILDNATYTHHLDLVINSINDTESQS